MPLQWGNTITMYHTFDTMSMPGYGQDTVNKYRHMQCKTLCHVGRGRLGLVQYQVCPSTYNAVSQHRHDTHDPYTCTKAGRHNAVGLPYGCLPQRMLIHSPLMAAPQAGNGKAQAPYLQQLLPTTAASVLALLRPSCVRPKHICLDGSQWLPVPQVSPKEMGCLRQLLLLLLLQ